MLRLVAALALAASPAMAETCADTEAVMRAEGVRALLAAECIQNPSEVPADWNAVFDTPAGACMASLLVSGDPDIMGLAVFMSMMNDQRRTAGCPLKG
jgi:hypothetical protein